MGSGSTGPRTMMPGFSSFAHCEFLGPLLGVRESPFVLAPRTLHFNTFSSVSACSS